MEEGGRRKKTKKERESAMGTLVEDVSRGEWEWVGGSGSEWRVEDVAARGVSHVWL
jgi:hypothetical protein